jgi:hypothetical protein
MTTPIQFFRTRIGRAVTGEIVVVHYAASGETHLRNDQYRDLKFSPDGKTDASGLDGGRPTPNGQN